MSKLSIQFADFSILEILVAKLEAKKIIKVEVRFAHQVRTQINLTLSEFTQTDREINVQTNMDRIRNTNIRGY